MARLTVKVGTGAPIRISPTLRGTPLSGIASATAALARSSLDAAPLVTWTSPTNITIINGSVLNLAQTAPFIALAPGVYVMDLSITTSGGVYITRTIEVEVERKIVAAGGG